MTSKHVSLSDYSNGSPIRKTHSCKQRLEVLAWMVAEGTLEIKVVLPRDERGLPIQPSR